MTTTSRTPPEYETESDGMRIFEEFDIKLNATINEIKKIFNNTIMELKEDYEEFSTRNLHEYGEREFNQMMTIKEWVVSISKYEEQVARLQTEIDLLSIENRRLSNEKLGYELYEKNLKGDTSGCIPSDK